MCALVAQRIEQLPSKQWVVGSIPSRGTIFLPPFYAQIDLSLGVPNISPLESNPKRVFLSIPLIFYLKIFLKNLLVKVELTVFSNNAKSLANTDLPELDFEEDE